MGARGSAETGADVAAIRAKLNTAIWRRCDMTASQLEAPVCPRREIGETQHKPTSELSDGTRKKRPAWPSHQSSDCTQRRVEGIFGRSDAA